MDRHILNRTDYLVGNCLYFRLVDDDLTGCWWINLDDCTMECASIAYEEIDANVSRLIREV